MKTRGDSRLGPLPRSRRARAGWFRELSAWRRSRKFGDSLSHFFCRLFDRNACSTSQLECGCLNSENAKPLRKPAERAGQFDRLPDSEAVGRCVRMVGNACVASIPNVHSSHGAPGCDRINQDNVFRTRPCLHQSGGFTPTDLRRDGQLAQPFGREHTRSVVAPDRATAAQDANHWSRSIFRLRKCVAQEMQGS